MAVITSIIPESNFEKVRDQIGAVLADEIANQAGLTSDPLLQAVTIWKDRTIAFDKTELPAINVLYNISTYDDNDPHTSKGDNKYTIEVITNANFTATDRGDTKANLNLQLLFRNIRYILENPNYLTLGFARGFIFSTKIESMRVLEPRQIGDALATISGLVVFSVEMTENNGDMSVTPNATVETKVKIDETDKGFRFLTT